MERRPIWPLSNCATASLALHRSIDGLYDLCQKSVTNLEMAFAASFETARSPHWLREKIEGGPLRPLSRERDGLSGFVQDGKEASVASFIKARRPQWPRENRRDGLCGLSRDGVTTLRASDGEGFFFKRKYLKNELYIV